jgi:hypothetical protein
MGPHIDFSPKPKSCEVICMGPAVLIVHFHSPQKKKMMKTFLPITVIEDIKKSYYNKQ